jgi:hypothetical protein
MNRFKLILACLAITALFTLSSEAEAVNKNLIDHGCTSVEEGTGDCFTADNGGTAEGISSCTARLNCVACEMPVGATRSICVEARRNASCKCQSYSKGFVYCQQSGTCTYKP